MIHKISLLTPFTSLLVCDTSDVLCLSINDIMTLSQTQQQEKLDLFKKLYEDIKRNSEEVLQNLRQLGLEEVEQYANDITTAKEKLIALQKQLQEKGENAEAELQKQISLLKYYIYLRYKYNYIGTLCNFIHIILNDATEEERYEKMLIMLDEQAKYIVSMDKYKSNEKKDKGVLKGYTNELEQEEKDVKDRYEQIVKIHKENIKYCEEKCNKYNHKQWFSLTIQDLEKLNTESQKTLTLAYLLVSTHLTNIKHEGDKILQDLKISLKLTTQEVEQYANYITTVEKKLIALQKQLQEKGENAEAELQEKISRLEYYIYLSHKSNYIATLYNFISSMLNDETEEERYEQMLIMLDRQAKYIVSMDKYKSNEKKDKGVLKGYTNELKQEEKDVQDRYEQIVKIHKENIKYCEEKCNKYNHKQWFSLTIQDLEKLNTESQKTLTLAYWLVSTHLTNIKHERNKILQELKTSLKLTPQEVEQYVKCIETANEKLIALKKQLQEKQVPLKDRGLQEKISRLEYYIYLSHKSNYVLALYDFIYIILNDATEEERYVRMLIMLDRQAKYIVSMDKYKSNEKKDKGVLKGHKNELKQEEKDVKDRYEQIVQTHKDNIEYIKETCKYHKKRLFSLKIILPVTLSATGSIVLIGYGIYRITIPKKPQINTQTKETISITSK